MNPWKSTRVVILTVCGWAHLLLTFQGFSEETDTSVAADLLEKYPQRVESMLAAVNTEYPGMEEVGRLLVQGEKAQALAVWLNYQRTKPLSDALVPSILPPRKDILELADDATHGIFTIQSKTYKQPERGPGKLDWEDLGPNHDKEWAWMLNRHPHFEFLITAYQSTRNASYLDTISRHLVDWIPHHAAPDHMSFSTSWRALEAARRITESWLMVFAYVRSSPNLSDEALFLLLSAVPEHANYLRNHYSFWGGNHKMTEKMAIIICALTWPEFKESQQWLDGALEVVTEELFKQTYPDGSYKELANHYQKVVAENYLRLLRMLENYTLVEVSPVFRDRVEAMWNYFTYLSKPSGFGPLNSDSSREDNFAYALDANRYFKRQDWDYILSYGERGNAPDEPASRFYPWAGHAVMRNNWTEQAHWAFFDIGPHGSAHQHWDRLHLSISIGGQDLLVDSGRYIYKPGEKRHYFRYGKGHNLVLVDGQDSQRPPNTVPEPMKVLHQIEPEYDAFGASVGFKLGFSQSEQVNHQRIVVYLRDLGWLIIDELKGYGPHRYDTLWNFHPDCLVTRSEEDLNIYMERSVQVSLRLLNDEEKGNWDLARGQIEPEIRGWYSWAYNERRPSTSARYRYSSSQPHINVWWIEPRSNGQSSGPTVRLKKPVRSLKFLEVEIEKEGYTQLVKWENGRIVVDAK